MAHPSKDLPSRINALIERHFEGNVRRAAQAWGVPQPSLHRLAAGQTRNPHHGTLLPIARDLETTVGWLRTGEGPNPLLPADLPQVEYREFRRVVDQLELDPETEFAVLSLPTAIGAAHEILCRWGIGFLEEFEEAPPRVVEASREARYAASALLFLSWAQFLDGLIRAYGRVRVREKLQSERARILLGFHPIALEFLNDDAGPALLAKVLPRVAGTRHAGVVLINRPTTPPLDARSTTPPRGRPRKTRPHTRYDEETNEPG